MRYVYGLKQDESTSRAVRAPAPEQVLLTPRQAALMIGVCLATLYNLMNEGRLKYVMIARRIRRIPRAEIERLADPDGRPVTRRGRKHT